MIVVRNVFRLKFGKSREAVALMKEAMSKNRKFFGENARLLTDLVGNFYTLVLELTFENMDAWQNMARNTMDDREWTETYHSKFAPLVESGYREILNVV
jgi:hypothetical protein